MFLVILSQVFKMFLLMMIGYLCFRTKLVDHQGNKTLSNLLLMVINPFLIVNAFQMDYTPSLMKGFLYSFLLAMLTHAIGILICQLMIKKTGNPDYNIERFSGLYSNCGFMGIPLISCIMGNEGVLYITAYMVAFNLLVWTHGLLLMTGETTLAQLKKGLTSPVMFGILIGLFLFVTQIQLPGILSDTIHYISALNTPIGMMIAGISLAETDLGLALKNKRLYLTTAIKLLLIPAVMLLILTLLPVSSGVRYATLIAAACPAATTCTMFALRYDGNYRYASEIFAFSTLLSMLTIPALIYAAEHFAF
ncbi:MAG: AEC family transporter [Lachnospiraceae bacterium]|nr:AEC family transporter [Lachnospiraceae bacterium]